MMIENSTLACTNVTHILPLTAFCYFPYWCFFFSILFQVPSDAFQAAILLISICHSYERKVCHKLCPFSNANNHCFPPIRAETLCLYFQISF